MRNSLPVDGLKYNELAIVNLDGKSGPGTHWVAYKKYGNDITYFNSFGNLKPPKDLMKYFGIDYIKYNYKTYQKYDTYNCGHLCLKFLSGFLSI